MTSRAVTDIFGKRGRDCLAKVKLCSGAQDLLREDLALLGASSQGKPSVT